MTPRAIAVCARAVRAPALLAVLLLGPAPASLAQPAAAGPAAPVAAVPAAPAPAAALDERIEQTKRDVLRLNRELMVLEEELLYPAGTQVAVFVSMDVGVFFALDSVKLQLNGRDVANHLYTPAEVQALHRGGVQRVFVGNLRNGKHELVAFFTGQGPHARDYRRGATVTFDKGPAPRYIELVIRDNGGKLQPEFEVKVWP
jgi:hypothetical protein